MSNEVAKEKVEKIAREIIDLARSKLLVNLRFMDMAVNQLEVRSDPENTACTACDGELYIYDPEYLIRSYCVEENLPIHSFLHSVMHCVFKHFFVNTLVDTQLWDLSCDIAAECVINDLDLPFTKLSRTEKQIKFFEGFRDKVKTVSAEKIYNYLMEKKTPQNVIDQMSTLFKADEHMLWYLTPDQKRAMGLVGKGDNVSADGMAQIAEDWGGIASRMLTEIESFLMMRGTEAGLLTQNLKEVTRERYNYTEFLKKFAVRGEVMKINPDEFDYNFYTYGLQLYENMPLIEPLEYKEVKRIRDFVIVIDTSGSVAGDLVQTFIQKTYNILKSTESFFTKINLHIIQCDAAIQEDIKITTQQEFDDYLKNMTLHGFGGTDFRPAFSYVNALMDGGEFENLKGLIYFTDGYGEFPKKKPPYDAAFMFIENERQQNNYNVPSWAIKLVLRKEEI